MPNSELIPDWAGEDDRNVPPVGLHVLIVRIERATFDESYRGKPFVHLGVKVLEGDYKDTEFSFDVYFSPKAERMARYFLKKFGYPDDLLAMKKTPLRSAVIVGLQGKVLMRVEEGDDGFLKFNSMGYAHWPPKDDAGELEKRLAKAQGQEAEDAGDDVPVIQLDEEEAEAVPDGSQDRGSQAADLFEQGSESGASRHGENLGRLEPLQKGEVIPGVNASDTVSPPGASEVPGDDPNFLSFLADLPRCNHGPNAMIEFENGEKRCTICEIPLDGPWDALLS